MFFYAPPAAASPGLTWVNRGDVVDPDFIFTDLTLDVAWYDLDFSGIVPEGATFMQLEVEIQSDTAAWLFQVKEKGYVSGAVTHKMHVNVANRYYSHRFWIGVNAGRLIEYKGTAGGWTRINITVVAWAL